MPRSVTDPQVKPEAVLDLLNQLGCFGMVLQVEQVLPDDKVNMGGAGALPSTCPARTWQSWRLFEWGRMDSLLWGALAKSSPNKGL